MGMTTTSPQEATQFLRNFGENLVPLIDFCEPVVTEISDIQASVEIPLNKKTSNHLGSLYFGALNIGADCAGGLLAMHLSQRLNIPITLVFKSSQATYLKRAEGNTRFTCTSGDKIRLAIQVLAETHERQSIPIDIVATVPSISGDTPVAQFQ